MMWTFLEYLENIDLRRKKWVLGKLAQPNPNAQFVDELDPSSIHFDMDLQHARMRKSHRKNYDFVVKPGSDIDLATSPEKPASDLGSEHSTIIFSKIQELEQRVRRLEGEVDTTILKRPT